MTGGLPALVSAQWLGPELGAADLRVIDATWYLPSENIEPGAAFTASHIPGAVRFDIDAIKDHSVDLPHMLPNAGAFARAVGLLGIGSGDRIIAYDRIGMDPSARVWWTFRAFGHSSVAVLDGGLAAWMDGGGKLESGSPSPPAAAFNAHFDAGQVRGLDQIRALTGSSEPPQQIVDARSNGRFTATEPEPRDGIRPGRMPGSLNVPSTGMVDPVTGLLLDKAALRDRFEAGGVNLDRPIVTSCGSGVTAALLAFALHRIGAPAAAVYDGSWTEWGGRADTAIER